MTGIISLLVIISLSILTTRIGALALVHTGLSKQVAKFQSRSAFMGVGFTTNEAELVVNHPVRRRILMILFFLGNAGIITTISSVIFSFISLEQEGLLSLEVLVLISGLLVLLFLTQSKWIDRKLSKVINKALERYTRLDVKDYYSLLHLSDEYRVSEIKVEEKNWMADHSLMELELASEGVIVLGIKRGNGKYVGAPTGKTEIKENDILILYGRMKLLEKLEKRKEGNTGDREHEEAKSEQQEIQRTQEND